MKQGNRSPGGGHILIGALVAVAAIAASQGPLALPDDDLLVVSAVTLLSLAAGLGVRLLLSRTRREVFLPPPRLGSRTAPEDGPRVQPRALNGAEHERGGDEHERDNLPSKATHAPGAAVRERAPGRRSAGRQRSRGARPLAGAPKG